MHKYILTLLLFLLLAQPTFAVDNPKSFQTFDVEIVKSGVIYSKSATDVNLKLYIPQENLVSIDVQPNDWKYVTDAYGNRMIQLHWSKPSETERYEVKMRVANTAKYYETLQKEDWAFAEEAKKETALTKANNEIREWAFGHESILEKAARLALWIDRNLKYENEPLKEQTMSAEWAWKNKKGVCGEFSNLFAAGLRSQGVPVRYVVGYVFTPNQSQSLWAHAWTEVFTDGKWVPFDTTWLEGGYLDAAHIKIANLMDSNLTEEISYRGLSLKWLKDPVSFRILNYTVATPTKLELIVNERFQAGDVGLLDVEVRGPCSLVRLDVTPCVDENRIPVLNVFDRTRKFWFCDQQHIYWLFSTEKRKAGYRCPITVYDQSGAKVEKSITVTGWMTPKEDVFITGPEQVLVGERFQLKTNKVGLFFSPNFTISSKSDVWTLAINEPGEYKFYFYADGLKGEKTIEALHKKEFSFIKIESPNNITLGDWFLLNVTLQNIAEVTLPTTLRVRFSGQEQEQRFDIDANEQRTITFNLTSSQTGLQEFVLTAESGSLSSYSGAVEVLEKQSKIPIIGDLIDGIVKLLSGLVQFMKAYF
jgi:transglutaminase-like putative cysteine protease